MTDDDIIRKIKKLLALSNSPNIHEAAAAAAKAQELIDRHNIQSALLVDQDDEPAELDIRKDTLYTCKTKRMPSWLLNLVGGIARSNSVKLWYSSGDWGPTKARISGAGTQADLDICKMLIPWIVDEIERLYKEMKPTGLDRGEGRSWANSFRNGAAAEIRRRLMCQKTETKKKMLLESVYEVAAAREDAELLRKLDTFASGVGMRGLDFISYQKKLDNLLQSDQPQTTTALARVNTAIARVEEKSTKVNAWVKQNMSLRAGTSRNYGGSSHSGYQAGVSAGKRANISGARGRIGG